MKKHILQENYERFFGTLNEMTKYDQEKVDQQEKMEKKLKSKKRRSRYMVPSAVVVLEVLRHNFVNKTSVGGKDMFQGTDLVLRSVQKVSTSSAKFVDTAEI